MYEYTLNVSEVPNMTNFIDSFLTAFQLLISDNTKDTKQNPLVSIKTGSPISNKNWSCK